MITMLRKKKVEYRDAHLSMILLLFVEAENWIRVKENDGRS